MSLWTCRRRIPIFFELRQECLPSRCSDEEKGKGNFRSVGAREHHVKRQNVNNKNDKTYCKVVGKTSNILYVHTSGFGKILMNDKITRCKPANVDIAHEENPISIENLVKWYKTHRCALYFDTSQPMLTQHMKRTPSALRTLSNDSKHTAVHSISTQLFASRHLSMIWHSEQQQNNKANKKQATKSTNMNGNNRSMLQTFCGEMREGNINFTCPMNHLQKQFFVLRKLPCFIWPS